MKVIGVIPARMAASRFPGKPMAAIHGMPMIGHCFHRTRFAIGMSNTYVATCDEEIAYYVESIGGTAIMTSKSHTRATTRTAEAIDIIEKETGKIVDIVLMVQGDEPLIQPESISQAIKHFADPAVEIVNIMTCLNTYEQFVDKNNVKVVVDDKGDALYFSREPIPSPWKGWEQLDRYMQTGIIAFRREALRRFNEMPETPLERFESVDMNRVLESGGRIRMVLSDMKTIGVDTQEELKTAEMMMADDTTMSRYN